MSNRAIVFAGQGAQFVGMGKDLAEAHPECKALFDRADETLGYSLSSICFEGPAEELTKSNHCQPGIFVASVACYTALKLRVGELDLRGTAGLSLGEWTALHVAGALSFEDTLRVLEARGRFMQDACEARDGTMVSVIGLSMDKLHEICEVTGVEIANLNSAAQTVLSGERAGIEEAKRIADEAGAKRTFVLDVAGAFHSSLMQPAADRFVEVLGDVEIQVPSIPVVANVTGLPHGEPDAIRAAMLKQVTCSVRWLAGIEWFQQNGVTSYIECGPGKVLSGLIRRIDRGAELLRVQDCGTLDNTAEALG
jgi:[acyl-carrier-protein] S-malonyltransferase